ncbi:MAG TPA: ABC transporter permease, partial [Spirochaetaceae bacterium]|nr:ABC transporter permease [Spirochaetaceae bacterium]
MSAQKRLTTLFSRYAVVIIFVIITLIAIPPSGLSIKYIVQEIITRLGRNSFLVLALLLPIYAGMGLNFGMTLGAMAGQIGLIFAVNYGIANWQGLVFALLVGLPVAVLLGWICGLVMNRAKGREMVTGYILAFFINGIYQFFVMYMLGSVIPIRNRAIVLSRGYGIRNTLNLESVRQSLDNIVMLRVGGYTIPLVTFIIIALLCVFVVWFKKTKLGQDM